MGILSTLSTFARARRREVGHGRQAAGADAQRLQRQRPPKDSYQINQLINEWIISIIN